MKHGNGFFPLRDHHHVIVNPCWIGFNYLCVLVWKNRNQYKLLKFDLNNRSGGKSNWMKRNQWESTWACAYPPKMLVKIIFCWIPFAWLNVQKTFHEKPRSNPTRHVSQFLQVIVGNFFTKGMGSNVYEQNYCKVGLKVLTLGMMRRVTVEKKISRRRRSITLEKKL